MARMGEIRSMVGIDSMQRTSGSTSTASTATTGAAPTELASAFSTELSSAVAAGDSTKINTLVQSLTQASATSSAPPASTLNSALSATPSSTPGSSTGSPVSGLAQATAAEKVTPPKTTEAATGSTAGAKVVAEAKQYLGVPYVWGGTNPRVGLDCSGLVQLVYKDLGYQLPRVARDQAKQGVEVSSLAKAQPGDLIGMRNGTHIAIYLGNNKILHAPQPGSDVSIRALHSRDDIDTIRRVVRPDETVKASTVSSAGTSVALTQYHQALNALSSSSNQRVTA